LAANSGNREANILFDTTSGTNASSVTTGTVAMAAGTSTAAINYTIKTNGAVISVPAIAVPGYIRLDNTCLGCNTAATPATAFLNGVGLTLRGNLSAGTLANPTGVTFNIVSNGSGRAIFQNTFTITSASGGVTITSKSQTGNAYYSTAAITATGQAITITTNSTTGSGLDTTGTISGGVVTLSSTQSTATATATPVTATGLITANSLTVTGNGGASSTIVSLGAITINAGGTNITVTANNATAGDKIGITQTGAITDNAVGSNISFISNNLINQTGAITLAANTGASIANVTYDTTTGTNASKITTGTLTVASGSNTAINYLVKTNGAIISVPAVTVPGYILLDNTCLGCSTVATTSTAFLNGAGVTITGALTAGTLAGTTGVTVNAVANGSGIGFTQGANAISSSAGGVTITVNGQTGIAYSSTGAMTATGQAITITTTTTTAAGISTTGVINGGVVRLTSAQSTVAATATPVEATGKITANSLTVTGTGGASTTIVSLGVIEINVGGGNILVTANNVNPGSAIGITQTGNLTNYAAGSNISFISNNKINQVGAIALAANTGSPSANILYDTTSGNKDSSIVSGALTYTAGAGTVIDYVAKSAGSAISNGAIGVLVNRLPGTVTLDNTFGCATAPCTKVSGFITQNNASTLATASAGITISNAIYSTGDITVKGVSTTAAGINYSAAINNTLGSIQLTGTSVGTAATGYGIYGSAAAGVISAADTANGYVSLNGWSSAANLVSDGIRTVASATITGAAGVNLFADGASGNITTLALIRNSGTVDSVLINAYGNVSTAGITNSGVDGIRVISGRGLAAGELGGGTVTALGTLTNTGGVIGISMAKPGTATGDTISAALKISATATAGFTVANASTNIAYGIAGGTPVEPGSYAGGNFINYRQKITSTVAVTVTLNSDYSAVYGRAYNSNAANDWLQANATVSYTGGSTAIFGLASTSTEYIKSVLIFSPTIGGTTALNGTNANIVQTNTTLTASSLSASDGSTVTLSGTTRTYTISPAVLGISAAGIYNGTTTITNPTVTATGLAAWDRITSVTVNNANANSANAYITAIGGTAAYGYTFSASNYVLNSAFNSALSSGLPVNSDAASATNTVSITPAPLGVTVSGVYSGTTIIAPTAFNVTGLVNGQTITGISSATINNINVAANNSNYVTALVANGGTASMDNYAITPAYNTVLGNTQNTMTLTPKSITVTGIAIGAKTYDGTTSATVTAGTLDGVASIDQSNASLSLTQTANFVTASAANDVSVNVVGKLAGTAVTNYTLVQPTGITANIARKTITVGGTSTAVNKIYDRTNVATIYGGNLVGVITADVPNVSLTQVGTFAQTGVANGIAVTVNASLAGTAATNYIVTQPANLAANITKKTLTVADTTVANKVYNANTAATVTGGTLVGLIAGDESLITLARSATFTSANAANAIPLTINHMISGDASGNYNLVQPTGIVANITPAPLGISVASTYSGSTTITPTTFSVNGLVNGETITTISSAVINSMNVSANSTNFVKSITISSGTANPNNYTFNTVANTTVGSTLNTVTLTAKALTVTGTIADSKTYDGTTAVSVWGGTLVGVIGIDAVTLKQTGVLNSSNVGGAVPVTMTSTISGFSSGNYTLVQPTGITTAITPKRITISDGTVANKVYDGTTNAVLTGGSLVGVLAADASNVVLTQAGRFSSPNVSNGIIIIASGSISGSASTNYTLVQPTGITANITPAMLGISVIGLANGTNNITPISFTINGLINGQTITSLSTVNVKSSSVDSNGSNFVTGIVISGGTALATNYAFAPSYNAAAGINQNTVTLVNQNQKIVTVTGTVAGSKVYDGTTSITVSGGTLVGVVGSDIVNLVYGASLVNANVSLVSAVAMNYSLSGTHAANYILVQPTGITAIVTPAPIGIVLSGTYNGTTTINPNSFEVTGLVNGETITGLSSATLNAANVSNNGTNYVSSIVSSGGTANLDNYKITQAYNASAGTARNTATLTAKALTVGGVSVADNKVYDGSTAASISGGALIGIVGSDIVTLNQFGTFAQSNVGNGIAVTSTSTLSGLHAANYSVSQPTGITGNITPKTITVSGVSVANKVYDGENTATVTGGSLVGLVGSDGANVSLAQTATFASVNVAQAITVTSVASITGTKAANYILTQPNTVTANITPKALTVTGTTVSNKEYDGTTTATFTGGTLSGVVTADINNVSLTRAGTFTSSNVGNSIAVAINHSISGTAIGNYTLTQPTGISANITAKALTITADNVSSIYGNTTNLGTTAFTQTGLLSGASISSVTLQYNGSNAVAATTNTGSYTNSIIASAVTGSGLSNYAISYVAGNLSVTPATLTITPTAKSTVYNGSSLNATAYSANTANYTVSGYKNTDSATNTPLAFAGALGFTAGGSSSSVLDAGTYGYAAGDLAVTTTNANYTVALNSTLTNQYVVTPATVSLTARKIYDGSSSFVVGTAGTTLTVATGIGSQTLTVSGSANANNANVIGVSSLNNSGLTLVNGSNGGLAANYVLPATTGDVAITPKSVTVTISTAPKQYDTTTNATLVAGTSSNNGSYVLSGFVSGEGAYITQTIGSYNSANVATASSITASVGSSYVAKNGTALTNYSLPVTVSGGSTIAPAPLTMTADNASTYIGIAPTLTYKLTGLIGADTASNSIITPTVSYAAGALDAATAPPTTPAVALVPLATSSNYALTFVNGSLTVAANRQMIINVGSNTTSYGVVNATNVSYLGNSLSSTNSIVAGYCTDCVAGNQTPTIINLALTAPAAGSNVWTATDSLGSNSGSGPGQGQYTFVITPTIPANSYSGGQNLNVGNYVITPSGLATVSGYATNYDTAKAIIYNAGNLSVTPKVLTVTGTTVSGRAYNGTNVATVSGGVLAGLATGDTATVIGLNQSGHFASVNVANGITVNVTGSLTGSAASNYVLTQPTGFTANITPAQVTIGGLSVANKVYNGNTTAAISGTPVVVGLIGSDTAVPSGTVSGTFAQSNVGDNLVVTANFDNLALNNTNYAISGVSNSLTANITPASISVSATKTYDGTNSVTAGQMTIAGITGETLTFAAGSLGTLTSPNVGSASLSSLSNAVLANGSGLATNYSVVNPTFSTVTITPAAITVSTNSLTKVYDATDSTASARSSVNALPALVLSSGSLFTNQVTGLQDTLSGGSFVYANLNAGNGNKTVNVSNASVVNGLSTVTSNYNITYQANTTSSITKAPVLIGGLIASNKTYNNNEAAVITGTPSIASGLLLSDTSNLTGTASAGTFAGLNVATGIVVTPDLTTLALDNNNYYIAGTSTVLTANITPAPVTISGLTAANKIYDTTLIATLSGTPTISGLLANTNSTVTGSYSGVFANANVADAKTITADLSALVLSNSNYYISGVTAAISANITPAPLQVGGLTASNKVYNTNTTAVLSGSPIITSGLLGSDVATLNGSATAGTYASSDVGSGISITPTLTGLSSSNANYYVAGYSAALAADITPAPVTISGFTAVNKVYDTTTAATLSGTRTVAGLLNNENVTINGSITAAFVGSDAGTGIAVSVNLSNLTLSNANYAITGLTAPLTANIAPAPLTVTAIDQTMTYGSPAPTLTYNFTGLLGNDASGFTGLLATNASSTSPVGNTYTITQGSLAASSNYVIDVFNTASMTVTPRPVTVTVTSGQFKVYGNADPSSFATSIEVQGNNRGLITGSTLAGSLVRTAGENVGNYPIEIGTIASANPNYAINFVGNDLTITARPITVTATSGQTKVYGNADGALTYSVSTGTLASFNGVTDTLTGTLAREPGNHVGINYAINAGTLTNASNPNYDITYVSASFATTARPIAIAAPVINKTYDGGYNYDFTSADLAIMNQQLVGSDTFNTVKAIFSGNSPTVGNNKAIEIDLSSVSITDGNQGRNYAVTSVNSLGNITPASLIVTAANDAKFRSETDAVGYAGALYKGFVNGETVANLPVANQTLAITRTNPTVNAEGVYDLIPGGHGAQNEVVGNYQVSYVNGRYTILGPQDLLVRATATTSYGTTPTYNFTAKYLNAAGSVISYIGTSADTPSTNVINLTSTGSTAFTLNDNAGGTLTTGFMPTGTTNSESGNVNAGQYNVTSTANPAKAGFANLVVIGTLIVEPKTIVTPNLDPTSISKVYDGNAAIQGSVVNVAPINAQIVAGDAVTLSSIGFYNDKNVGTAKEITVNFGLTGNDVGNYILSSTREVGPYGAITQLNSVTYIGPAGGSWSDSSNWAGGAIPDLSNVANVVIPTGMSVAYDAAVAGPVTSQVAANGSLNLAGAGASVSLGGISGAGSIALGASNLSLTAAAGNFAGSMAGTGGLTIAGGTQTLSGNNTFTGNTVINANANLIIGGAGTLGNGDYAGTITNNGNFEYASTATQTITGVISGTGDIDKTGTGTLILGAANTYSGATNIDSGTLAITNASALGSTAGATAVNTGGTLDLRNVIGVTEPITVNGGTLATSTGSSSVTSALTVTGSSIIDVDGTELTISGVISGNGSIDKEGSGTLVLESANTYTGATEINGGTIAITDAAALGSAADGTTVNTGGTLDLRNVTDVEEPITLAGGTLATSTGSSSVTSPMTVTGYSTVDVDGTSLTITDVISGTGSIDKEGAGTLVLESANTYSGVTEINGGTIAITNAAALGTTAGNTTVNTGGTLDLRGVTGVAEPITLAGGTLAASTGNNSVTGPITLTGNGNNPNGSSTIDVDGTSLTITNVISGTGGIDKTGTGDLVLESANTHTGSTSIDAGRLILGANASVAESEKIVIGANGVFDTSAITGNVYINSLAGAGSVVNGSIAPNSLVIKDAIPGDVFSGVISGTGGLLITGGTQTLTGLNTYSGPTVVGSGANLIAAIQSIPGDIVNNGSFGFSQSTPGTYDHNMSGTGAMVISGSGPITLTGTNTQAGGTTIKDGSSLIIGSVDALSGNTLQSNNGSLGIADGIVLSSLDVDGTVTLTTDIYTTGAQSYNNIKLAPSLDNETTLQTVNSDIMIRGTLDATVGKVQSIVINAGTANVTLGDSIGSIARPDRLVVTGARIFILADILTGNTQTYNGAASIGDGTHIGKALVKGFLFDDHLKYFDYEQANMVSTVKYKNNDPRYVRTLVSMDPTVTFNGTVDDVGEYTHTLLVAAIAPDEPSARSRSTMPIINFNNSVSQTIPLYSLNAQTLALNPSTETPNLNVFVGEINLIGSVTTYSDQVFRSEIMKAGALTPGGELKFSVVDPTASVVFNLPMKADNSGINLINTNGGRDTLVINGSSNLSNAMVGSSFSDFKQNAALGSLTQGESFISGRPLLNDLKTQAEMIKEQNLLVGEVTIDELEEESIDCAKSQPDQPLDPKCRPGTNI
jgi:autotransporter-associated beta strand protein